MDKLFHLSDSQLDQILRAATPLAPKDRSPFLADVAAALHGKAVRDHIFRRMMGGDVTVKSEPGKGSVFTVRLPGDAAA
jgi:hypothetical protein